MHDLSNDPDVGFGQVRLKREVASEFNVGNGVLEFILVCLDVLSLTVITSILLGAKDLHWNPFFLHDLNEAVSIVTRQSDEVNCIVSQKLST